MNYTKYYLFLVSCCLSLACTFAHAECCDGVYQSVYEPGYTYVPPNTYGPAIYKPPVVREPPRAVVSAKDYGNPYSPCPAPPAAVYTGTDTKYLPSYYIAPDGTYHSFRQGAIVANSVCPTCEPTTPYGPPNNWFSVYGYPREYYECNWVDNFMSDVKRDFAIYFCADNLLQFGNFFIAAAILANTGLDRTITDIWRDEIESNRSHNFFKPFKAIGGLSYWYFPLYLSAMTLGYWRSEDMFGNIVYQWGYRNLRAFLLGGIQEIILAPTLGGGRPSKNEPSKWQPFKYKTGVSGHAFFGALPFITAAMMADPPIIKGLLYIASTLPGLSRIDSEAHYASQVLLGWALAYFSARAVYESDQARLPTFQLNFVPKPDGGLIEARARF